MTGYACGTNSHMSTQKASSNHKYDLMFTFSGDSGLVFVSPILKQKKSVLYIFKAFATFMMAVAL